MSHSKIEIPKVSWILIEDSSGIIEKRALRESLRQASSVEIPAGPKSGKWKRRFL
jgi:hypothetical protein